MKKLAELTEADTGYAHDLGCEIMRLFMDKNVEMLVAMRALEMVSSTVLHGAKEVEGRDLLSHFIDNVSSLYQKGSIKRQPSMADCLKPIEGA